MQIQFGEGLATFAMVSSLDVQTFHHLTTESKRPVIPIPLPSLENAIMDFVRTELEKLSLSEDAKKDYEFVWQQFVSSTGGLPKRLSFTYDLTNPPHMAVIHVGSLAKNALSILVQRITQPEEPMVETVELRELIQCGAIVLEKTFPDIQKVLPSCVCTDTHT